MLQYDDTAFHFFVLSTLACYLTPAWFYALSRVFNHFSIYTETTDRTNKAACYESSSPSNNKNINLLIYNSSNTTNLVVVVTTLILTVLFFWTLQRVLSQQSGVADAFDPYYILGVDRNTSLVDIKKAFRKLVLEWHPDHCQRGEPICVPKFRLIKQAYEVLTDPIAREVWEKTGNPDGNQTMELSLGLPTFLLDLKYRNLVLLSYLIFIVILIPYSVWRCYSNPSIYGENNVLYKTYAWYNDCLTGHTVARIMPEILAGSGEFRERLIQHDRVQNNSIITLMKQLQSHMIKPKWNHPIIVNGNTLLHAHLLRKTDFMVKSGMNRELENLKYMLNMFSLGTGG